MLAVFIASIVDRGRDSMKKIIDEAEFDDIITSIQQTGHAYVLTKDAGSHQMAEAILIDAARVLGIDREDFDVVWSDDRVTLTCRSKKA